MLNFHASFRFCPDGNGQNTSSVLRDMTPFIKPGYMVMPHEDFSVFTIVFQGSSVCVNNRLMYDGVHMCPQGFQLSPQFSVCVASFYYVGEHVKIVIP